jgi:uncharacterized RDD family membrane protein YckC
MNVWSAKTMDQGAASMGKAGVGQRFIALVIDSILLGIVTGIIVAIVGNIGTVGGFLIGVAYQWYFLTQNKGQTPGKILIGIRVVKTNGAPLTAIDVVIRYIGYYINTFFIFIGWLWAIWDDNHQGWHDKLAGTYVVKA